MGHRLHANQPHDYGASGLRKVPDPADAGLSRRSLARLLMLAPASLVLVASQRTRAVAAPSATACVLDDADGMPATLHYAEKSPFGAAKSCGDCQFWTAAAGGGCGACEMMHRSTLPTGHCDAWAAKSGS